jgi:hypothetical protein
LSGIISGNYHRFPHRLLGRQNHWLYDFPGGVLAGIGVYGSSFPGKKAGGHENERKFPKRNTHVLFIEQIQIKRPWVIAHPKRVKGDLSLDLAPIPQRPPVEQDEQATKGSEDRSGYRTENRGENRGGCLSAHSLNILHHQERRFSTSG